MRRRRLPSCVHHQAVLSTEQKACHYCVLREYMMLHSGRGTEWCLDRFRGMLLLLELFSLLKWPWSSNVDQKFMRSHVFTRWRIANILAAALKNTSYGFKREIISEVLNLLRNSTKDSNIRSSEHDDKQSNSLPPNLAQTLMNTQVLNSGNSTKQSQRICRYGK